MKTASIEIDSQVLTDDAQIASSALGRDLQLSKYLTAHPILVPLFGIVLIASSSVLPAIDMKTYQIAQSKRNIITANVSFGIMKKEVGRRISRAEALALCQKIMEDAERERLEVAEWEAQRGLPREVYQ